MKLITTLIICAAASSFQMMEDISTWILKTPRRIFSELKDDRWAINDSILSIPITEEININEQCDTIYVADVIHDNRQDLHRINVWKNNSHRVLYYTESKVSSYDKKLSVYYNLVKSWEPDLIRHIGNEAQLNICPITEHYLARIIFNKGATRIDTVSFCNLGEIDRFTIAQLDSIRKVVMMTKKMDSIKSDKDSVHIAITAIDNTAKNLSTGHNQKPPQSIWQRFVDWLRKIWEAIFG